MNLIRSNLQKEKKEQAEKEKSFFQKLKETEGKFFVSKFI